MEKYIKVKENKAKTTHLKIRLFYTLGGMNYGTYQIENRGYYLSVIPVEYKEHNGHFTECYTAFLGVKQLIKEVTRQSKKSEEEAEKIAKTVENKLIDYVCRENGLELAE